MAQVRKYAFGGVYNSDNDPIIESATAADVTEESATAATATATSATASATAATASATAEASPIVSSTANDTLNVGMLEINGIVKPFTTKAYATLTNRVAALGDSFNAGDFQHLIDLGSQKGNTLHFNSAYNQGYVTDASGNVIARTQDGWRQRNGADVVLGGVFNSRKNVYNKELSTIFKGLSEDLFTDDAPTAETAAIDIAKNPFATPLLWIDENDKNEYSAYDPTIVAARQRLDDIEKYITNKDLWTASNEFDSDSQPVKNYIDSLGISFTPEIRRALRDAIATPHLLTEDQMNMLRGLNIGFGRRVAGADGAVQYFTPKEWKDYQKSLRVSTGGGGTGGVSPDGTVKPKTKPGMNIFDGNTSYVMWNGNTIMYPEGHNAKFDADKCEMLVAENGKQLIYKWVDTEGKICYVPITDATGKRISSKGYNQWQSSWGDQTKATRSSEDDNVQVHSRSNIRYTSDGKDIRPIDYMQLSNGSKYLVYHNYSNGENYICIDNSDGTRIYYKATKDSNGKWTYTLDKKGNRIRLKKEDEVAMKFKEGGVLFAKLGTPITSTKSATSVSESDRQNAYEDVTTTTRKPQRHAGDANWSAIDKARMAMAGLGVASAGVGYVPVYGDAIGTVGGLISDAGNFVIDLVDKDVSVGQSFKNLGTNLSLTALALLPGMDTAKLAKNAATLAKTTEVATKSVKAAKAAIEAADNVADINKAMKGVKTAVEASNVAIDGVKSTKAATEAAKALKHTDTIKDTYRTTKTAKGLANAKAQALADLQAVEKTFDNASSVGKSLFWGDLGKNTGQVALRTAGTLGHVGLKGLGLYTAGTSAIDVYDHMTNPDEVWTPEQWMNATAVLTGALGIGRRVQRSKANKKIFLENQPENHTYDGVRFRTSSTIAETANKELESAWLAAGRTKETLPTLADFGYKTNRGWFGKPDTISEVKVDLPSYQVFKRNPYNVSAPEIQINPITNPYWYSLSQALPTWMAKPRTSIGYYGLLPGGTAQRLTYLHPGEETTTERIYYKEGGYLPKFKPGGRNETVFKIASLPQEIQDLIENKPEDGNITKDQLIKVLREHQVKYDKYTTDSGIWNKIKSSYDFVKNEDGTYDFAAIASRRSAKDGEGEDAKSKYGSFNWGAKETFDRVAGTKWDLLSETDRIDLFGKDYNEYLKKTKELDEKISKRKSLDDTRDSEEFNQDEYDKLSAEISELQNSIGNPDYAQWLQNVYADRNELGIGITDSDIEAAKAAYDGSVTPVSSYQTQLNGLLNTSRLEENRFINGKDDFNTLINKGNHRSERQGAWRNHNDFATRTPLEKMDDADLAQAFGHTENAKEIGLDEAGNRHDARASVQMNTLDTPLFDDTGLHEAEDRIESTTNTAMNDVNMSTDNKANFAYKASLNADRNNQFANLGVQRSGALGEYLNKLGQFKAQNNQIEHQNLATKAGAAVEYSDEREKVLQSANNLNSSQLHQWFGNRKNWFEKDRMLFTGMESKEMERKALRYKQMTHPSSFTSEDSARLATLEREIQELSPKMKNLGWSSKYFG